jgi:hypothetical protein
VLPTAELRRNGASGYVCKENAELGKQSRCWKIYRELQLAARAARRAPRREAAQATGRAEA